MVESSVEAHPFTLYPQLPLKSIIEIQAGAAFAKLAHGEHRTRRRRDRRRPGQRSRDSVHHTPTATPSSSATTYQHIRVISQESPKDVDPNTPECSPPFVSNPSFQHDADAALKRGENASSHATASLATHTLGVTFASKARAAELQAARARREIETKAASELPTSKAEVSNASHDRTTMAKSKLTWKKVNLSEFSGSEYSYAEPEGLSTGSSRRHNSLDDAVEPTRADFVKDAASGIHDETSIDDSAELLDSVDTSSHFQSVVGSQVSEGALDGREFEPITASSILLPNDPQGNVYLQSDFSRLPPPSSTEPFPSLPTSPVRGQDGLDFTIAFDQQQDHQSPFNAARLPLRVGTSLSRDDTKLTNDNQFQHPRPLDSYGESSISTGSGIRSRSLSSYDFCSMIGSQRVDDEPLSDQSSAELIPSESSSNAKITELLSNFRLQQPGCQQSFGRGFGNIESHSSDGNTHANFHQYGLPPGHNRCNPEQRASLLLGPSAPRLLARPPHYYPAVKGTHGDVQRRSFEQAQAKPSFDPTLGPGYGILHHGTIMQTDQYHYRPSHAEQYHFPYQLHSHVGAHSSLVGDEDSLSWRHRQVPIVENCALQEEYPVVLGYRLTPEGCVKIDSDGANTTNSTAADRRPCALSATRTLEETIHSARAHCRAELEKMCMKKAADRKALRDANFSDDRAAIDEAEHLGHYGQASSIKKTSNVDANDVAINLLLPALMQLSSYRRGSRHFVPDAFNARLRNAPEWCYDRGPGGDNSFFGGDWGTPPARVGRDPRYRRNREFRGYEDSIAVPRFSRSSTGGPVGIPVDQEWKRYGGRSGKWYR